LTSSRPATSSRHASSLSATWSSRCADSIPPRGRPASPIRSSSCGREPVRGRPGPAAVLDFLAATRGSTSSCPSLPSHGPGEKVHDSSSVATRTPRLAVRGGVPPPDDSYVSWADGDAGARGARLEALGWTRSRTPATCAAEAHHGVPRPRSPLDRR
jgi:hypothetical protein